MELEITQKMIHIYSKIKVIRTGIEASYFVDYSVESHL